MTGSADGPASNGDGTSVDADMAGYVRPDGSTCSREYTVLINPCPTGSVYTRYCFSTVTMRLSLAKQRYLQFDGDAVYIPLQMSMNFHHEQL